MNSLLGELAAERLARARLSTSSFPFRGRNIAVVEVPDLCVLSIQSARVLPKPHIHNEWIVCSPLSPLVS